MGTSAKGPISTTELEPEDSIEVGSRGRERPTIRRDDDDDDDDDIGDVGDDGVDDEMAYRHRRWLVMGQNAKAVLTPIPTRATFIAVETGRFILLRLVLVPL